MAYGATIEIYQNCHIQNITPIDIEADTFEEAEAKANRFAEQLQATYDADKTETHDVWVKVGEVYD